MVFIFEGLNHQFARLDLENVCVLYSTRKLDEN